jgi:hypothetical protein
MDFELAPLIKNENGNIRSVGFELEFAELPIEKAVASIQKLFGGDLHKTHQFYQKVKDSEIGDFTIKFDTRLLTQKSYRKVFEKLGIDIQSIEIDDKKMADILENVLESISADFVPYEIVTPPVPMDKLHILEKLRAELFKSKAKGTRASMFYAFATHINPELPEISLNYIIKYERAFFLLLPWLHKKMEIDFSRKVPPFINPFPEAYIDKVLHPEYNPTLELFVKDYHQHNPSRNRPLDLYPVLGHLNASIIENLEGIGNVKTRPTLHYRLPNSLIDEPEWSLAHEWNLWVKIEKMACTENLNRWCKKYTKMKKKTWFGFKKKWISEIENWNGK